MAKRGRIAQKRNKRVAGRVIHITLRQLAGMTVRAKKAPVGTAEKGSRLRKVGPEAKLKAFAIKELNASGLLWWRNQSGAIRVAYGKKTFMVKMGCKGLSDLMAVGADGKLYAIELKAPKGVIRPDQKEFFRRCKAAPEVLADSSNTNLSVPYTNKHIRCFFARSEKDITAIIQAAKWGSFIDESEYQS